MSLSSLIANGGKVLVIGSFQKAFESYRKYPQLEFWSGEQKDIVRYLRDKEVPANCRAIICSRFISHSELWKVSDQARKRNLVFKPNLNDGEISKLLDEILEDIKPAAEAEVQAEKVAKQEVHRGKLNPLIEFIDFSKTNTENARILLKKAEDLGIETTNMSLQQLVVVQRRKKSGTALLPSIKKNKLDLSVEMLDSVIKDIQGMRDFLIELTEENRMLKAKQEKFEKMVKALSD